MIESDRATERPPSSYDELVVLHAETKAMLAEAEAALSAVRASAVDALVAGSGTDLEVLTLVEDGDRFFRVLVAAMQEGAASLDVGGTVLYANKRLAGLLGLPLERVVGRALAELAADASGPRVERLLAQAARGPARAVLDLVSGDGRHVPVTVSAAPLGEERGELCLLVTDMSEQRRAEAELGRAEAERERLIRAQAAREQAEQISQRLQVVQRITDVALSSLAFDELVQELLRRTADVLSADTAAIVLHDETDGEATVHEVVGAADAGLQTRRWQIAGAAHPFGDAVTSVLGVPLVVEGRPIGALHIGTLLIRRFTDEDASLLGLAADRAALAIERVRVFEHEHRIAQELQRSLLPGALPQLPGVSASARYQPAGAGSQVGGDWYDTLIQPGGRLLLVIGDVTGRGIKAASMMGQLRSALRAYAFDGHSPGALLERLNAFQVGLGRDGMATVALVSVDPATEELCYATAGHPPALLVSPDGDATWLQEAGGLPLGVLDDASYTETIAPIPPGSTLVMYTDVLVETRGEHLDRGFERLEAAVLDGPTELESLCDVILERTLSDPDVDDDVTLLVLRTILCSDPRLELSVSGNPAALRAFRVTARRWMAGVSDDSDEVDEVTMAANEAVQNAIEHGHDRWTTPVSVVFERIGDDVEITVADWGRWIKSSSDSRGRGRGIPLMRALMDDVAIDATDSGTSLVLRRHLRSPAT